MVTFVVFSYRKETPDSPSDCSVYLAEHEHDLIRWLTVVLRANFDRNMVNMIFTTGELTNLTVADPGTIFSRPAIGTDSIRIAQVREPAMTRYQRIHSRKKRSTLRKRLCAAVGEELRKQI